MKRLKTTRTIDLIIIRHLKRCQSNHIMLRRIVSDKFGITPKFVEDRDIIMALVALVDKYDLVPDWKRFMLNLNPKRNVWWGGKELGWEETIIDAISEIISHTDVSVFGEYPEPAYYRNFCKRVNLNKGVKQYG